ncbi:hypothetical protein HET64_00780, partial [Streptomyces sp. McG3]|nr:hypothetical protein [Streptomyces sp. McG3]
GQTGSWGTVPRLLARARSGLRRAESAQDNLRHQLLRAIDGDGTALADQLLHAVVEMSDNQRTAAAEVIGKECLHGYEAGYVGELRLREAESAVWQILYAYSGRSTWDDQQEFLRAWKDA